MSNGGFNGSYVSKGWNSIKTGILSNIAGVKRTNVTYNALLSINSLVLESGISLSHAGGGGGGILVVEW